MNKKQANKKKKKKKNTQKNDLLCILPSIILLQIWFKSTISFWINAKYVALFSKMKLQFVFLSYK